MINEFNENLPIVVLIGRPNVGKSTLFNRLIKKKQAIESSEAHTTRDPLSQEVSWRGKRVLLMDTAGYGKGNRDEILEKSIAATKEAIANGDLVVMVADAKDGVSQADLEIAKELRKSKKPVVLAINKSEGKFEKSDFREFRRAGIEEMVPVSAISGQNSGDLLDLIFKNIHFKKSSKKVRPNSIKLAILGRPNVGKSTLINAILGMEKAIVSDVSGTTRDALSYSFDFKGTEFEILDTAGIRRKSQIDFDSVESFAYLRSMRAIKESDVICYVVDGIESIVSIDLSILGEAKKMGKSMLVAVNKTDLYGDEHDEKMASKIYELQTKLNFMPWIPVVFISAINRDKLNNLLTQAKKVYEERFKIVGEDEIKKIFLDARDSHHQIDNIKSLRFLRANPPVFKLSTYKNQKPHFSHIRYLENKIRDVYPYFGTPIFIDWESK